jgi:hypothetical protein
VERLEHRLEGASRKMPMRCADSGIFLRVLRVLCGEEFFTAEDTARPLGRNQK